MIVSFRRCCLPVLFILCATALRAEVASFPVLVPQDVIDDYREFIGARKPQEVMHYHGEAARRDVIELVLIQQALATAGAEWTIQFQPMRSYRGILRDVAEGGHIMAATSVWVSDAQAMPDAFYLTHPVLRQGQFEAGFYTASTNKKALQAESLEQLQNLKAVTNRHWRPDWETLEALGIKEVRDVRSWESVVRLLELQRADFTLAPFNAKPGMTIEMDGCVLAPIPNLKTSLSGERAFVVSRAHPRGKAFFDSLQAGLDALQAAGTVERAYRECGFINPEVKDWQTLSPNP